MTRRPFPAESLEILKLVLDVLPVGVWIMDAEGRITHGNPAGERIWAGARYVGPERFGEYKGWWAETGAPIAAEEWAAARAIERGEISLEEVVDIECFDGSRKTILNSALPIRDDEDRIIGAVIVNHDITERRRVELERDRLTGLLPICAHCKKIRDGEGRWQQLESYIRARTEAEFSHGLCEECIRRHYPGEVGRWSTDPPERS